MAPCRQLLFVTAVLAGSVMANVTEAATPIPDGPVFVVVSLDFNAGGGVALDEDGNMVVSWNLFFGGPAARGYDSSGTPVIFFNIQPYGGLFTDDPMDSTALGINDFVFVWEGSVEGLQARRYNIMGEPLAAPIQVTPAGGSSFDIEPAIARWAPGSEVLVVWSTDNPATGDSDGLGIDARGFDAAGTPLGPTFRVNDYTASHQQKPDIAVAANNGFLIVWESDGSDGTDGDGLSIQAHRFSASGQGSSSFQVNSLILGDQQRPAVALAPDGRALVVWEGPSAGSDPDGSIQGRIIDASGVPLGSDFQINTATTGTQSQAGVAAIGDDCFQVVWRSATGISSQVVSADGALLGQEQKVATATGIPLIRPTVAANSLSSVVSWAEDDPDDLDAVFVQRYLLALFADGFESADTSAWSATTP